MIARYGRPGLLGVAARTAVAVGTANAVSNRMERNRAARAMAAAPVAPPPPPPAPSTPVAPPVAAPTAGDDVIDALERLAGLHAAGILSDDELQAQKARILGG